MKKIAIYKAARFTFILAYVVFALSLVGRAVSWILGIQDTAIGSAFLGVFVGCVLTIMLTDTLMNRTGEKK